MKITIMDTTLRDGEQTSGVSFTGEEKLSIAKLLLDDLKVDRIEVASARVSEGEYEAVSKISAWAEKHDYLDKVEVLGICGWRCFHQLDQRCRLPGDEPAYKGFAQACDRPAEENASATCG